MDLEFKQFRDFFLSQEPKASAFYADPEKDKSFLFAASLESIHALIKWTHDAKNQYGHLFNIVPGFLDVMSPNAAADKDDLNFYMAMNVALFVSITEFSMFAFAQKGFFPDIGDSKKEVSPQPLDGHAPGVWLLQHTSRGKRVNDEHSSHLIPKCPIRYETSIYLSQLMIRFVWLHELAHCFNGHLGLVRQKNIALRLYELEDGLSVAGFHNKKHSTFKTLQLLEYEADRSAFWASLRIQSDNLENMQGIIGLGKTISQKLTLFGTYAMTWLFEEFRAYLDVKNNLTHPAPYMRLHNLFRIAKKNLPQHIDGFESLNTEAYQTFDAIRQSIPKIYSSTNLERDMQNSKIQDMLDRIVVDTEQLHKDLEPFKFSECR